MLHFNILHYQIQSNMHNFTLFSREIEWNLKCFHFFREMKSETNIPFTLFEKWKVKWFFVSLFSRSESEIEIPRDRDREVKFQKKSREFSRNETLAGYWTMISLMLWCLLVNVLFDIVGETGRFMWIVWAFYARSMTRCVWCLLFVQNRFLQIP